MFCWRPSDAAAEIKTRMDGGKSRRTDAWPRGGRSRGQPAAQFAVEAPQRGRATHQPTTGGTAADLGDIDGITLRLPEGSRKPRTGAAARPFSVNACAGAC